MLPKDRGKREFFKLLKGRASREIRMTMRGSVMAKYTKARLRSDLSVFRPRAQPPVHQGLQCLKPRFTEDSFYFQGPLLIFVVPSSRMTRTTRACRVHRYLLCFVLVECRKLSVGAAFSAPTLSKASCMVLTRYFPVHARVARAPMQARGVRACYRSVRVEA